MPERSVHARSVVHAPHQFLPIGSDARESVEVSIILTTLEAYSFLELFLYNMRHVQEHAAQLNLFLGQNAIDGASDWVPWANADKDGE
ncbi:MAG TPA: hypothetical protein VJ761_02555 [Ktedonobacteraceae bacterium]|nr:hypothetical protein [Ktedonobacteraceae bacterium]